MVDEEQSLLSSQIIGQASNSPHVKIVNVTANFLQAEQMVHEQKADGILLLPNNLTQSLRRGETGGIGLYLSTTNFLKTKEIGLGLATSIEATLKEYVEKFGERTHFQPALSIHQVPLFNPLSGYGSYIFPAVATLIIHQTIVLGLAMLIASYREKHEKITSIRFAGIFASLFTTGCLSSFTFWFYLVVQRLPTRWKLYWFTRRGSYFY